MSEDSIYARIDAAFKEIAQHDFRKDGRVQGSQGYKFIPINQILNVVRTAHANHGVKVIFGRPEYSPEQFEKRYTYKKVSRDGYETTWTAANGHIDVRIVGAGPDDMIEMTVPFEAQDNADKLTNKILTNAERCLYRTLYAIDEDDANDAEAFNDSMESKVESRTEKLESAKSDPFFGKKAEPTVVKGRDEIPSDIFITGDKL